MTEINKKIDEVIVKIWEMSSASQEPIVRQETLGWAREELRQLFPQPKQVECKYEDWDDTTLPHPVCHCLKREGIDCANVPDDVASCPDYEPQPLDDKALREKCLLTENEVANVTSVQFSDEAWEDVQRALKAQQDKGFALLQPKIEEAKRQSMRRAMDKEAIEDGIRQEVFEDDTRYGSSSNVG